MVNPITYLKEVSQELQRVTWPDQSKTINMTVLVIVISLLVAGYIAGADLLFRQVMNLLIGY